MKYEEIYDHAKKLNILCGHMLCGQRASNLAESYFSSRYITDKKDKRNIINVQLWLSVRKDAYARVVSFLLSGETLTYKRGAVILGVMEGTLRKYINKLRQSYDIKERQINGVKEFWMNGDLA